MKRHAHVEGLGRRPFAFGGRVPACGGVTAVGVVVARAAPLAAESTAVMNPLGTSARHQLACVAAGAAQSRWLIGGAAGTAFARRRADPMRPGVCDRLSLVIQRVRRAKHSTSGLDTCAASVDDAPGRGARTDGTDAATAEECSDGAAARWRAVVPRRTEVGQKPRPPSNGPPARPSPQPAGSFQ